MGKILVSRKEHFCAAHKLYNPDWSAEKNKEIFGPCANENWHGHNFDLVVTVKGEPDPETGFVVELKALSNLIKENIIDKVDHKNLNLDVEFMAGKITSCENLVYEIWQILAPKVSLLNKNAQLHSLRLHETANNFIEYYGEN